MQKETAEKTTESTAERRTVLRVDLGVDNLAVTSTSTFWSADGFNRRRREYEKRRGDLQQCGSRHAHGNIESIGRKETGRFDVYLHTVANELIAEAIGNDCLHIVFEDLTHTRMDIPKASWQHVWAFRRLYEYAEYKAEEHDVQVVQTHGIRRIGIRRVGLLIETIGIRSRLCVSSAATRTMLITTQRRTSACSISVVGKVQATEAHP